MQATELGRPVVLLGTLGAVTLGLLVIGCIFASEQRKIQIFFLSKELSDASVQGHILFQGTSYEIRDGSVQVESDSIDNATTLGILRVAYERELALRNPYFAIAGTQPEKLDIALDTLEMTRSMLGSLQHTQVEKNAVTRSLYPMRFLRSLVELEKARLDLIESGSDENASLYENLVKKTSALYQADLIAHARDFADIVPKNTKPFGAGNAVVRRETFISAMDTMMEESELMQRTIRDRHACSRGTLRACDKGALDLKPIDEMEAFTALSEEEIVSTEHVRSLLTGGRSGVIERPLVRLAESMCTENMPGTPIFTVGAAAFYDPTSKRYMPMYVGNIRLIDTETNTDAPFYRYYREHGIRYLFASVLAHYECFDAYRDTGAVSAVFAVARVASESPLSIYADTAFIKRMRAFESSVGSLDKDIVIVEADAQRYVNDALHILTKRGVPNEMKADVSALYLGMRNYSAMFDLIVENIAKTDRINMELARKGQPIELDAALLFYLRSGFTTLFLTRNESITGRDESFFSEALPYGAGPYVYFSELPRSANAEVVKGLKFYFSDHDDSTQ